jgi:uncharacterized membrane protein
MLKKITWVTFAILCISIGFYPTLYLFSGQKIGLLNSKSPELLANLIWNIGFYSHITLGGIALLTGWSQFSEKLRKTRIQIHRLLGKIYVGAVFVSSLAGIGIAFFATGGPIPTFGFLGLGLVWFFTTVKAYTAVKAGNITLHQKMMIYSYAACFAAVTLRLWLPLLQMATGDFITAYRIVAWLAWVPNMIVAYFWVQRIRQKSSILNAV